MEKGEVGCGCLLTNAWNFLKGTAFIQTDFQSCRWEEVEKLSSYPYPYPHTPLIIIRTWAG
jgi:hypothetical protein